MGEVSWSLARTKPAERFNGYLARHWAFHVYPHQNWNGEGLYVALSPPPLDAFFSREILANVASAAEPPVHRSSDDRECIVVEVANCWAIYRIDEEREDSFGCYLIAARYTSDIEQAVVRRGSGKET